MKNHKAVKTTNKNTPSPNTRERETNLNYLTFKNHKMKKQKDYTLLALFIPFFIAVLVSGVFGCNDAETPFKTPVNDSMMIMDTSTGQIHYGSVPPLRDYQIEVTPDSITVFDGDRKVGTVSYRNTSIDSLIMLDNQ